MNLISYDAAVLPYANANVLAPSSNSLPDCCVWFRLTTPLFVPSKAIRILNQSPTTFEFVVGKISWKFVKTDVSMTEYENNAGSNDVTEFANVVTTPWFL